MNRVAGDRSGNVLQLQLLGERALRRGEDRLDGAVHYRKGWALLGYLALERQAPHPREHLSQLLWPQLAPASARTNLRQVVADLKQALDAHGAGDALQIDRDAIALVPTATLDIDVHALEAVADGADSPSVAQAEQRAQALSGEFLQGLQWPDCLEFEEWLQAARRRVLGQSEVALQRLCTLQELSARLPQAAETARRLLALDEWNEAYLRLLMRLLAGNGEAAQALAAYDHFATQLRADIDAQPQAETAALRERIARGEGGGNRERNASGDAAARRWISVVYCEVRSRTDETRRIDWALEVLARVGDRLRREGGWVLPASGRTVMACFDDRPLAGDSAFQAAQAASRVREGFGGEVAVALCAGLARIEAHAGAPTVLGNPAEWALRLCLQAQPGQVVVCESVQRQLRGRFATQALPERVLPGLGRSVPVWELGAMQADAGAAQAEGLSADAAAAPPTRADPHVTQRVAVSDATAPRNAWLEVVQGSGRGRRTAVAGAPVVIGRSTDADLQVPHGTVSRHHCAVWRDGTRYRIRDMGSTNLTRVNGAIVQEAALANGDQIQLGDSVLRFGY
ncbi:MAG TPA: FHA domain-containing protein [Stenotrophomonas sp.]|nr:FHA domain-containing protein [Stenotrophomonas sp.]